MTDREQKIVTLADKVMGWLVHGGDRAASGPGHWVWINKGKTHVRYLDGENVPRWNPFESIADAWMLVDALVKRGLDCRILVRGTVSACILYSPTIKHHDFSGKAATAPEAICKAALAALTASTELSGGPNEKGGKE